MKYMQFVGIGKNIDIVYEYENCINFSIEADVPHNRENKPKLCK